MKTSLLLSTVLLFGIIQSRAAVLSGPMTNPANQHDYFLLAPGSWTAAEREAENLGGTLVIINDAAEQDWVFATFGHDGNEERSLWIGLHRERPGGPFVWVDGTKVDYVDWHSGQPDDGGGKEAYAHMWATGDTHGQWNDAVDNTTICAVVEVPGKTDKTKLDRREKMLIGNWYESGKPDREAWIAGTHNNLFLITHDHHVARLIFTPEGFVYNTDKLHGQVVEDKIVWSNGTWWSRKPAGYENKETAGDMERVLAGPTINPSNNHEYYLLAPNTWTASETTAEELGGTLAVIRNAAEQEWVFSQFGNYAGTNRSLWIGRWRSWPRAPFASVTDENVAYYNWDDGQPDDCGGIEYYVQILTTGKWNDNSNTANPVCGVVEVQGSANEKALTQREQTLIGNWFNNGDPNQPCWIAGTDRLLFAIDQNRSASRVFETPEGFLFSPQWKQHIVMQNDKLLWSRGNWWSREPVKFKMCSVEPTEPGHGIKKEDSGQ